MSFRHQPRRKISADVKAPLLIAAGLIGVPLAIGLSHAWSDDEEEPAPADGGAVPAVDANTAYPMNHFVPGAGYYHVPYHAWFPFPYNYYDGNRGWYRGGQWRSAAEEDEQERRRFASGGGGGAGARWFGSSRPLPDAVQRANAGAAAARPAGASGGSHVIRGGFGFSAHPSGT